MSCQKYTSIRFSWKTNRILNWWANHHHVQEFFDFSISSHPCFLSLHIQFYLNILWLFLFFPYLGIFISHCIDINYSSVIILIHLKVRESNFSMKRRHTNYTNKLLKHTSIHTFTHSHTHTPKNFLQSIRIYYLAFFWYPWFWVWTSERFPLWCHSWLVTWCYGDKGIVKPGFVE